MANRDPSPLRRTARDDLRVWPAALLLVVAYLVVDHLIDVRKTAHEPIDYRQLLEHEP